MISGNADGELRRLAEDPDFPHRDAARQAVRFRAGGDVADLLAVQDDPHPCGMTDVILAMAAAQRPWLNWVPMPGEAISNVANEVGRRRAEGDELQLTRLALSAAEPASAITACRRVAGHFEIDIADFPEPDIRVPLRPGRHAAWRYDGSEPLATAAAPPPSAVAVLHEVAGEPWASPLSGYLQAAPLGKLPLDELLGLLAHLPDAPDTPRWRQLAKTTPTYWYRLLQPWVCLGLLHHAADEPWSGSARRAVLADLAFGVEDWVSDAALFALVTAAFREPSVREEVRELVRARLDAAMAAHRLVTIEESLARLMLVTPGCRPEDRETAANALANAVQVLQEPPAPRRKRRWYRHPDS